MNYRTALIKMAFASFEARLLDSGINPEMVKTALTENMVGVPGMAGEVAKKGLIGGKGLRANFLETLLRMKNTAIHGTVASKETTAPGMFHNKKYIKKFVERANKIKGVNLKAPGVLKRIGTSGLRGLNRLTAVSGAYGIGHALLSKRKRGEGLFESAGRRAGRAAGELAFFAAGGPIGTLGTANFISSMAGGPSLSAAGGYLGKGIDKGIRKTRNLSRGVRKFFGGGSTLEAKKRLAMTKRPRLRISNKNRFKLKAGYQ